jgi:hypothetical protein
VGRFFVCGVGRLALGWLLCRDCLHIHFAYYHSTRKFSRKTLHCASILSLYISNLVTLLDYFSRYFSCNIVMSEINLRVATYLFRA